MITANIAAIFERELNKLAEEIKLYTTEESIWMVKGDIKNSGGNLCLHICGNLQHFIGAVLGNTGYVRNRDKEFSDKNIPVAELLKEIEATKKVVVKTLQAIPDSDLDKEYTDFPVHLLGKENISKFYFLTHLVSHLGYHLGRINYHRRMML
ncbi:MAG TPA: DUF1572 family protein [Bacteroidia bacterium]|jgi:hypothetical protein|nr:DUF1572 family protein [Bacteroidia bacterium]